MWQEQFELYLQVIRGSKDETIKQYARNALPALGRLLGKIGYPQYDSLYDVNSFRLLCEIEEKLLTNTEYLRLNKDGHRMYSSGLHAYMRYAKGTWTIDGKENRLTLIDHPMPKRNAHIVRDSFIPNRDRIIVRQVIASEDYLCECDQEHQTFIADSDHKPYMEGHHLVPLQFQAEFDNSLDVYANVLSLCPTCHRMLHHAEKGQRERTAKLLFERRQDRLCDAGIRLGVKEFLELLH